MQTAQTAVDETETILENLEEDKQKAIAEMRHGELWIHKMRTPALIFRRGQLVLGAGFLLSHLAVARIIQAILTFCKPRTHGRGDSGQCMCVPATRRASWTQGSGSCGENTA